MIKNKGELSKTIDTIHNFLHLAKTIDITLGYLYNGNYETRSI